MVSHPSTRPCIFKRFIIEKVKLASCFLMTWKGGTVKGIVHVSERSELLVEGQKHECQARCTRCHQQNHIHIVSSQKITVLQIRYAGLSDPLQSAASHARHGNQSSCPR